MEKYYKTDSLHIAAYLMMKKYPYVGTEQGQNYKGQKIVLFLFKDEKDDALQVSREFHSSEYKNFVDMWKFLRDEIFQTQGR